MLHRIVCGTLCAAVSAAYAGQVREMPEVSVPAEGSPAKTFAVCAARLAEHTLRNSVASGEKVDLSVFEGLAADVAMSWNRQGLSISLEPQGRGVSGDAVASAQGLAARVAFENGKTFIPWNRLSGDGSPVGELDLVLDLEWEGLSSEALKAAPRDVRRSFVHTSMSALTAKPQFQHNPHLPNPKSWGRVVFGGEVPPGRTRDESGAVSGFSQIGCIPGTRIIDGSLDDWSGAKFSRAAILPDSLGGRYAMETALAYGGDALFIAVRISSPDGVPVNSAAAETGAGFGGGDALQFRISPDGTRKVSFCAWMSPGGPAFTVDTNDPAERDLLARGASVAFGREKGFTTLEMSVPYELVGAKPKTGDEWRMTFQPWWNAPTERFAFFCRARLENPPAKTVDVALPRPGAVSLGVFDGEGHLVRTLLKGEWREGKTLSEAWDVKDQWGKSVAPGRYVLKGLVTDGIRAEYVNSFLNPGDPAWPTADGRGDWLSDEAPPQGVATDGTNVFIAAPGSEKGFAVMALGPDGRRIWGVGEEFYPRCVSLSYLDGKVYALFSGPVKDASAAEKGGKAGAMGRAVIVAYDAKTGRHAGFSARNPRVELGMRWPYREDAQSLPSLIASKSFSPENYIGQPRYFCDDIGETDNAIGFAALPGVFAVSKFYDDKVELYDAATLEKCGEVAIEAPAGLCRTGERELLAISGKTVARIEVDCPSTKVMVASGLAAPVALTTDAAGNIYVSDWAGEMCVKKFAPDGRPLGIVGKRGGRPWIGAFDKDGMLLPHGLAVTKSGMLYVAEADVLPKRISAWDASSGKFVKHWTGPAPYGGMSGFWVDPDEPGFFHAAGCRYSWDMERGAWDVVATEMRRMSDDQPFVPNAASCMSVQPRLVKRGGETFLAVARRNETVWLRKMGDFFTPCAAAGGLHSMVTDDGTGLSCWDSDIGKHLYRNRRPQCFKGHSGKRGRGGDNFAWADLNGDGLVQSEEMTWCETLTRGDSLDRLADEVLQCEFYNGWGAIPASDGTLAFAGFAKDGDCIWRLAPRRWAPSGPVFDIRDARPIHRETASGGAWTGVYSCDGGTIVAAGAMKNGREVKSRASLAAFSADGRVKWEIAAPKSLDATDAAASGVNGEWNVRGAGRILCTWNWWWNFRPYFTTEDGLYVGTFGEETAIGPAALWGESATYFFQTKDGRPHLVNGANQAAHVFAIRGLEDVRRFEGTVEVTERDLELAAKNRFRAQTRRPPKTPIRFDGAPVELDGGGGRTARISLLQPYGSGVLHIEADVEDSSPMLQTGTDPRTLFITGDCVDVMLACNPGARQGRRKPGPGDKRLLLSEIGGKGVAVLFEPVVSPRPERTERLMACEIDRISVLEDAKVEIARRDGGYRLVAEVPLSSIGLEASDRRSIHGDVGVIFSGAAGGRELRLYHYNKDTAMTSDLTTEATLQPHEWGLMLRNVGKNLIDDPSFGAGECPFLVETTNHVSIGRTIPLPSGTVSRNAHLRMLMRSEGLVPEDRKADGKPGAWIAVWAFVKDAAGRNISQSVVYRRETDAWDWTPCVRHARHDILDDFDAIGFPLPEGAAKVRLDFKLTTRGQSVPARAWVDGVQFSVE